MKRSIVCDSASVQDVSLRWEAIFITYRRPGSPGYWADPQQPPPPRKPPRTRSQQPPKQLKVVLTKVSSSISFLTVRPQHRELRRAAVAPALLRSQRLELRSESPYQSSATSHSAAERFPDARRTHRSFRPHH